MEEVTQTRDRGGQGQRLGPVVDCGVAGAPSKPWTITGRA
jgi:hypothetical protein